MAVFCMHRTAAEARVAAIGVELEQRETSLRQQLTTQQAASEAEVSRLTADVARLTHDLDLAMTQVCLLTSSTLLD